MNKAILIEEITLANKYADISAIEKVGRDDDEYRNLDAEDVKENIAQTFKTR